MADEFSDSDTMTLQVTRKDEIARGIDLFELRRPGGGELPEFPALHDELRGPPFGGKVVLHPDGGDPARSIDLWPIVEERKTRAHLYCCGPRPLMQAVRDMTGHWSSAAIHMEAFSEAETRKP